MGEAAKSTRDASETRLGYAARVALYYAAMCSVFGVAMPYLNVWYDWRGLTVQEIAIFAAVGPLVRVFAGPLLSFLADRHQAHRHVLIGATWVSFLAWWLLSQSSTFWPLLVCHVCVALAGSAMMPLAETVAMAGVRARGLDYGRMRLWGSASFIAMSLLSGMLVARQGAGPAIWLMVIGAASCVIAAHFLPRPDADGGAASTRKPLRVADALALVKSPVVVAFLIAAGAVQGAHAVFYVFGVLHWRGNGLSDAWCGALWAISVIVEIALFWDAGRWIARFGALGLLGIGAAASIVRWTVMAFDPPLALLVPLQVLHALTYAASHIGAMHFLARAIPDQQSGTAQGLYAVTTGGIAMAIANQIAGATYTAMAGKAYLFMAMLGVVSLLAVLLLRQRWAGGQVGGAAAGGVA